VRGPWLGQFKPCLAEAAVEALGGLSKNAWSAIRADPTLLRRLTDGRSAPRRWLGTLSAVRKRWFSGSALKGAGSGG